MIKLKKFLDLFHEMGSEEDGGQSSLMELDLAKRRDERKRILEVSGGKSECIFHLRRKRRH